MIGHFKTQPSTQGFSFLVLSLLQYEKNQSKNRSESWEHSSEDWSAWEGLGFDPQHQVVLKKTLKGVTPKSQKRKEDSGFKKVRALDSITWTLKYVIKFPLSWHRNHSWKSLRQYTSVNLPLRIILNSSLQMCCHSKPWESGSIKQSQGIYSIPKRTFWIS